MSSPEEDNNQPIIVGLELERLSCVIPLIPRASKPSTRMPKSKANNPESASVLLGLIGFAKKFRMSNTPITTIETPSHLTGLIIST